MPGRLLHLDIKPANIYLRNSGEPLLIDFGAAREGFAPDGAGLPPIHTPGFASPEHSGAGHERGPWSDIYSVGATLYACIAGAPPPPAPARLAKDRLVPARKAWAGRYSAQFLDTVDWCLRLDPAERPQSGLALQKALGGERAPVWRREAPVLERLRDAIVRFAWR